MAEPKLLILASQSKARRAMLENCGIAFEAVPAAIDEAAIMAAHRDLQPSGIASRLAAEKALAVSRRYAGAYVIGSDQVVDVGGTCFSKVETMREAREVLISLRGRTHELVSAVALVKDGSLLWQAVDRAVLTMRNFSDDFLDGYLDRAGERVLWSAGCYELEGLGLQLFDRFDGDYFTILGMPLMGLLGELRRQGLITT